VDRERALGLLAEDLPLRHAEGLGTSDLAADVHELEAVALELEPVPGVSGAFSATEAPYRSTICRDRQHIVRMRSASPPPGREMITSRGVAELVRSGIGR
jgi:hypothetical protein